MKRRDDHIINTQKTDASEKLVREDMSSASHKSDIKALKDQNGESKDSDHKEENAANAKNNPGHYQSHKK